MNRKYLLSVFLLIVILVVIVVMKINKKPAEPGEATITETAAEPEETKNAEDQTEAETTAGSVESKKTKEEQIIECSRTYMEMLIRTLDREDETRYTADQFDTIEGYVIARAFMIHRDGSRQIPENGIHDLGISDFTVYSVDPMDGYYEVSAHVSYHYVFNKTIEAGCGCSYKIKVVEGDGRYRCADIMTRDDDTVNELIEQMAFLGIDTYEKQLEYVEEYFSKWEQRVNWTP